MSRLQRHGLLAAACAGITGVAWWLGSANGAIDRASLTTAWLSTALFVAALSLGPLTVLMQRRRPASNILLRRDLGIWVAITGLVHFGLGNIEAMNGTYVSAVAGGSDARLQMFNWGAILGTLLAAVFIVLLLISNNRALARLGPRRWKRWQRLSYLAFTLTILHGLLFQLLELRTTALIVLLAFSGLGLLCLQLFARHRYLQLRQDRQ